MQSMVEDAVKDVAAKYKADRALLKETYKALANTPAGPHPPRRPRGGSSCVLRGRLSGHVLAGRRVERARGGGDKMRGWAGWP